MHRTEVVESTIRNEELDKVLKCLGIEEVTYYQVRYTGDGSDDEHEDELKRRGGFSAKEANKKVSHAPLSIHEVSPTRKNHLEWLSRGSRLQVP